MKKQTMYYFILSVITLGQGDCFQLGNPDWNVREQAQARLAWTWPLCYRTLLGQLSDENPEVRLRAGRVLAPWTSFCADMRAAALLLEPWPVDQEAFWQNYPLRRRVQRVATANDVPRFYCDRLTPDDEWSGWCQDYTKALVAAYALDECRTHLGIRPAGWPFR